jgi:hypothetical protein
MRCYCSICRKTAGGGGYAINIMGLSRTLEIDGRRNLRIWQAMLPAGTAAGSGLYQSSSRRHFCGKCGSALWVHTPEYAEWIYPFASAIDTALPVPPTRVHVLLGSKAPWVVPEIAPGDQCFDEYPDESIEDWHKARGLWVD